MSPEGLLNTVPVQVEDEVLAGASVPGLGRLIRLDGLLHESYAHFRCTYSMLYG